MKDKKYLTRPNVRLIIVAAAAFILGFSISFFLIVNPYQKILTQSLSEYSSGAAVVHIGDETIGKSYLQKRITLYKKYILSDPLAVDQTLSEKVLKKLIDNRIILDEASKTGFFKTEKAREYLWIYLEEAMINYYLDSIIDIKMNKPMSDADIEIFYKDNKALFDKSGITHDSAVKVIRMQLEKMASADTAKKMFYRKAELGKLKSKVKIRIADEFYKTK